jgi:methionyl-tRNA formyltransferase
MRTKRRIVLLTGDQPEHCHVARTLASTDALGAIVIDHGVSRSRMQRLRVGRRRFGVLGLTQRFAWQTFTQLAGENARERAALTAIVGTAVMPKGIAVYDVNGVNASSTVELLHTLVPNVLCVYGTSVVKQPTLSTASQLALNMHTGISPQFRGADCAFWPLHEGQPQWLGATVHECTSAVDGGAIYGTSRALLERDDGIGAVFGRSVVAGADLYARILRQVLNGGAFPIPQDLTVGREYRAAMRTWRAELRVKRMLSGGLIRDYVAAGQPVDWSAH